MKEYPLVYKAALTNQLKAGNPENHNISLSLNRDKGGFMWHNSIEGREFWAAVYDEQMIVAKKICPYLFKVDKTFIEKVEEELVNLTEEEKISLLRVKLKLYK